jgi:ElaB/YqjD/DUF883 family membrane-anchored ribosome-binding protein
MSLGKNSNGDKNPEQLEQEINRQRLEIDQTIQALEEKFSSRQILNQAAGYFNEHGREFAANLSDMIKANPVPTLLTCAGLTWLMMGPRHSTPPVLTDRYYFDSEPDGLGRSNADKIKDKAAFLADKARHTGQTLKSKTENATASLREHAADTEQSLKAKAARAKQAASKTAAKARNNFDYLLEEQPLALGAIGIAIGALLGASLPRTEMEDKSLGKTSDQVKSRGADLAAKAYTTATEKGEELARTTTDSAQSQHREPRPGARTPTPESII